MSFDEYKKTVNEFISDAKKISDAFQTMSREKRMVALAYISGLSDGENIDKDKELQKIG